MTASRSIFETPVINWSVSRSISRDSFQVKIFSEKLDFRSNAHSRIAETFRSSQTSTPVSDKRGSIVEMLINSIKSSVGVQVQRHSVPSCLFVLCKFNNHYVCVHCTFSESSYFRTLRIEPIMEENGTSGKMTGNLQLARTKAQSPRSKVRTSLSKLPTNQIQRPPRENRSLTRSECETM